jgi:large subunit ribosomal protein L21
MKAILEIGGKQLKVEKGKTFIVNRLEKESGKKVTFDNVLLIEDKGKTSIGNPILDKASVSVSIVDHLKGDKVIVFKKKRRKGYKVKNGHRQYLTKIKIENISLKKVSAKKTEKKEEKTK